MFLLRNSRSSYTRYNVPYCVIRKTLRNISNNTSEKIIITDNSASKRQTLEELVERYESKLLYNTIVDKVTLKSSYQKRISMIRKTDTFKCKMEETLKTIQPIPLSLKYLSEDYDVGKPESDVEQTENKVDVERKIQFPYLQDYSTEVELELHLGNHEAPTIDEEMRQRNRDIKNWMTSYDNFENDLNLNYDDEDANMTVNYGTPDPKSEVSNISCGGCGAYLHCKDTAIPGYIPSEIFKNHNRNGGATLKSIVCQRCYFLKEHNMALQVRVSPEDYPKILSTIRGKQALVLLMVDLLDFPCSIWPGIADILGSRTQIFIVGNKVDLLPKDCNQFLTNIKRRLLDNLKINGFGTSNIIGMSLISAKTLYGIEDLITALASRWQYKGDVYLVGCTNVGKSSLFNVLLQSDYCKLQAADLIQRATVSQWPGTTLNLLKFPITRLSGYRRALRHERLSAVKRAELEQSRMRTERLINTNDAKSATLIGHIGQSFTKKVSEDDEKKDSFSVQGHSNVSGSLKLGIQESHPDFATSKWCYDTPGVVQPDQIINLLTVEELMLTIPKELIRAQTFCVKPGMSLFIGGLARLDYLDGPQSVRLTVFRSNNLPITICRLDEADLIYKELLGTELFKVPMNELDRLSKWPGLEAGKPFKVRGIHWVQSSKDVVLSSAGWIAINCGQDLEFEFQGWTPEKRGLYIRDCILPKAVMLRGPRISKSLAYRVHKFI